MFPNQFWKFVINIFSEWKIKLQFPRISANWDYFRFKNSKGKTLKFVPTKELNKSNNDSSNDV